MLAKAGDMLTGKSLALVRGRRWVCGNTAVLKSSEFFEQHQLLYLIEDVPAQFFFPRYH